MLSPAGLSHQSFFFEDLPIFNSFRISIYRTLRILPCPDLPFLPLLLVALRQVYFYFRVIRAPTISQRDDPEEVSQAKIEYLKHICEQANCAAMHIFTELIIS